MVRLRQSQHYNISGSLWSYLTGLGGILAAFFGFIYWLAQPVILANPGMAAYKPPTATRVVPLAREIDASEVATLLEPAPETLPARVAYKSHRPDVRQPPRKRSRVVAGRQHPLSAYAYSQEGNGGYSPWERLFSSR
jgi:hypothetical protein